MGEPRRLRTDQDWAGWLRELAASPERQQPPAAASAQAAAGDIAGLWDALEWLARRHGFTVDRPATTTAESQTTWASRRILITGRVGSGTASQLLLHELAHVVLHDPSGRPSGPDTAGCGGLRRIEADSVACVVATWLGLYTGRYRWPYVTSWAGSDPRARPDAVVQAATTRIASTASTIISHLEVALLGRQPRPGQADQPNRPHADVLRAVRDAEEFYQGNLGRGWAPGYLSQRGLDKPTIRRWHIGFAPGGWTILTDHLRALGHDDEVIEAAGLAKVSARGTLIDHFRNRVMVPITGADGVIAGFIGRAHPKARPEVPKYLNSPETSAYRKSHLLFGLAENRQRFAAGATPVIVEGPFDAIAVCNARPGAYAGLAPCGTALTTHQVTALARTTDIVGALVLVALDGDRAGREAALRAYRLLKTVTSRPAAVTLPPGQDPAEILRTGGPKALHAALQRAEPLARLVIDAHLERWQLRLRDAEGHLAAVRSVTSFIASMVPPQASEAIAAITSGRQLQTLDERLRPVANPELALIASALPAVSVCQIARAADRLDVEYSEIVAAVANASTTPASPTASSAAAASFPAPRPSPAATTQRAPPPRRAPARLSSAPGRGSGR